MTQLNDSEKIEILIDQVGRMTESITELRMSVEHMSEGISGLRMSVEHMSEDISGLRMSVEHMSEGITEFRRTVEGSFAELKTVSERQERNIDRLVGIVETLIQERRSN